jgi:hypothetical protein
MNPSYLIRAGGPRFAFKRIGMSIKINPTTKRRNRAIKNTTSFLKIMRGSKIMLNGSMFKISRFLRHFL